MAVKDVQLPASFRPTHQTAGLSGFPATDVFGPAGDPVLAPVSGRIVDVHMLPWNAQKRTGGVTAYLQGTDGNTYFLTHLGGTVRSGQVKAGEVIGQVGAVPNGWWASHIHEGRHQGMYQPGSSGTAAVTASVPGATGSLATIPAPQAAQTDISPLLVALLAHRTPVQPFTPSAPVFPSVAAAAPTAAPVAAPTPVTAFRAPALAFATPSAPSLLRPLA